MYSVFTSLRWLSLAVFCSLANNVVGGAVALPRGAFEEYLNEAILLDILQSYSYHEPTTICSSSAELSDRTTFSFDWPGPNSQSGWKTAFAPYEQSLFQAVISHNDTGNRSWSMRIGTGGNMYSHYFPNMHGETLPPQQNEAAPWIDEVQQSVAVPLYLNTNANCFVHQAGAYQNDGNYTASAPFFSPRLAKYCKDNSCYFASWGTQAHVPNRFTSPIMYINKYSNCGNGIVEHTQMIHNFADPLDTLSTPTNTDYNYFNTPWTGVRPSALRYVLEPRTDDTLNYNDVNNNDHISLCKWGTSTASVAKRLYETRGYTTFVNGALIVNHTSYEPISLPCRTSATACNSASCMVSSCNDTQINGGGYVRMELKVAPNTSSPCIAHSNQATQGWLGLVMITCDFHDSGFGSSTAIRTNYDPCSPWTDIGLFNSRTGRGVHVALLKYWSWNSDKKVWFAVYSKDKTTAVNMLNDIFSNAGSDAALPIEIRPLRKSDTPLILEATPLTKLPLASVPADYNPSSINAFTYVYGRGEANVAAGGASQRRIGSTDNSQGRDFTVLEMSWAGQARLTAGETYTNRGYYFSSNLGSVKETADILRDKIVVDKIGFEEWSPRVVNIYKAESNFVAKAATSSQGQTTTCASSSASLVCSGTSTPKAGHVPFFYMTCGSLTYLGPNPYHFTPSFGTRFPGHAATGSFVRPYLCNDYLNSTIRPLWKLIGFFNSTNVSCNTLANITYAETVCDPDPVNETTTESPSSSPIASPSASPSKSPKTSTLTKSPSHTPTASPSNLPTTFTPTNASATTASPTSKSPTTSTPTKSPSASLTESPSVSPSKLPSASTPIAIPSKSPTTSTPTASPSKLPSASTSTKLPSSVPTASPFSSSSKSPTTFPTQPHSSIPSYTPTAGLSVSISTTTTTSPSTSSGYTSSTQWFIDWTKNGGMCVADCVGVQPCGRKRDRWETAFPSVEVCCRTISSWKPFTDCSYAISSPTSTTTSPSKSPTTADTRWYPDYNTNCRNDGKAPTWLNHKYTSQSLCCMSHFSWEYQNCMGIKPTASNKWYIDWTSSKCKQDCEKSEQRESCGGPAARAWVIKHDSVDACCRLHVPYAAEQCKIP